MAEWLEDKISEYTISFSSTMEQHVSTVNIMITEHGFQPWKLHIIKSNGVLTDRFDYIQEYIKKPHGLVRN